MKEQRKFKVAHVTTVHPWWDNRIYEKMVSMLPAHGWAVTYLAQFPPGEEPAVAGVTCVPLRRGKGLFGRICRNMEAFVKCLRLRGHIIHFHDPEFMPYAIVLRLIGRKVVYDIHEDNLLGVRQKDHVPALIRNGLAYFVAALEAVAARLLAIVIAERAYAKRFPRAITVLNYLKSDELSSPAEEASFGQLPEHRNAQNRALLYTGSLSADRGAFNHIDLLRFLPDHHLYMVGRCDRELERALIARAGDAAGRLHLTVSADGMPYGDIEDFYRRRNWEWALAVFPRTENYFEKELTKFFEYMFYRIPVICSDFPVWRALVGESNAGICVDESNLSKAAETIAGRAGEFDSYRAMTPGLKPEYVWDSQLKKLLGLYATLVE